MSFHYQNQYEKCFNCLLPETHETIEFDDKNVCNICNQHKFKNEKIDWSKKRGSWII